VAKWKKIGKAWATGGTSLAYDKLKERREAETGPEAETPAGQDVIERDDEVSVTQDQTPSEAEDISASAPASSTTPPEAPDALKATLEQPGAVAEVVTGVQTQEPESPKRSRRQKVKDSIARVQVEEGGFGGSFWYLYSDSVETHDGVFPLSKEVTATVDNEVKQQFAPAKLLALGVLGATKKRGGVYLTVEGYNFHSFATVTFRNEKAARKFAARLNGVARQLPPSEMSAPESQAKESATDVTEQIRKLGALRDDGLITNEEFEAKKKQLLGI
jgi:hypothetical protein